MKLILQVTFLSDFMGVLTHFFFVCYAMSMSKCHHVIFMGTPECAVPMLRALVNHDRYEVVAVVTKEDKKMGRKQILTAPPVKIAAIEEKIPVLQPQSLKNNPEIVKLIKDLKPDFIVVAAYGEIIPEEIATIPKHGSINWHPSLLPKYRGACPVEEALLHGDKETGVTFIEIAPELDSGDILLTQKIAINSQETAITLYEKVSQLGATLLPYLLQEKMEGLLPPIPQNNAKATYCRKIEKEDGLVNPQKMTAEEIYNHFRAYIIWPTTYMERKGKKLKLVDIALNSTLEETIKGKPGELIKKKDGSFGLSTLKGTILLKKVQLEGKNVMGIEEFLRGNSGLFALD